MSKLINQSRLQQFATKLWAKIKERYDDAFVDATLTAAEKKIKFTKKKGGATVDVDLADYARLQDRNGFKQDVSADNVAITNNSHIGSDIVFDSRNRSVGFRQLTTSAFVDGYVDHIRIYVEGTDTSTDSTWTVWAITKDANRKEGDRVAEVICDARTLEVSSITEGSEVKKFVKIPITKSFENETYFIVRCTTHNLQVLRNVKQEYSNDSINMNDSQPPKTPNTAIDWASGGNTPNNTAIMYLFGRESIGSLSLKLKQTQADSSLYVKHTDCVTTGGAVEQAGKVVKLDDSGKLNKNMLPSIAINEYIEITAFTNDVLRSKTYENGDVVVVTSGTDRGSRYLCINKDGSNLANLTDAFIKLNDKDGIVTNVNGVTGAVTLNIEATTDKLQLKVNNEMKSEVEIITNGEIDTMINDLN